MQTYLVLGLIFAVGVAVFAVQNAFGVDINFFFWKLEQVSLVIVIFGSALVGAAATALFGLVKQVKQGVSLRKFKGEIDSLNTEIALLQAKLEEFKNKEGDLASVKDSPAAGTGGTDAVHSTDT